MIDPWRLLWDLAWQLWIAQLIILITLYVVMAGIVVTIIIYLLYRRLGWGG